MLQKLQLVIFLLIATINGRAKNRQNDLDKYFSTLSGNQQFNGNVLIAENGKIVYPERSTRDFPQFITA